MSKKSKKSKKSKTDDAPEDEMLLAMMLQNAKVRGLRGCRYATYGYNANNDIVACCALGAAYLDQDTAVLIKYYRGVAYGNDSEDERWDIDPPRNGESLGYAFRKAMQDEEKR